MCSRDMKTNLKLQIFKVVKFTFETRFSHFLWNITFDDKAWRFQLGIPHLSTYHNKIRYYENLSNSNNIWLLLLGVWPQKLLFSIFRASLWSILPCLHPINWVDNNVKGGCTYYGHFLNPNVASIWELMMVV